MEALQQSPERKLEARRPSKPPHKPRPMVGIKLVEQEETTEISTSGPPARKLSDKRQDLKNPVLAAKPKEKPMNWDEIQNFLDSRKGILTLFMA